MKPSTLKFRRNFPAVVFGVLTAVLIGLGVLCATGCQAGYWDRTDKAALEKAQARVEYLETALTTANNLKDKADAALKVAQTAIDVAVAAGAKKEQLATAQEAVAKAEAHKAEVYKAVADLKDAVSAAKEGVAKAASSGGVSAAESDAEAGKAILGVIGGFFGPVGIGAAGVLGTIWQTLARRKSESVTAKIVQAIEAAKTADGTKGEDGEVHFNDPATQALMSAIMGKDGKAAVDKAQANL